MGYLEKLKDLFLTDEYSEDFKPPTVPVAVKEATDLQPVEYKLREEHAEVDVLVRIDRGNMKGKYGRIIDVVSDNGEDKRVIVEMLAKKEQREYSISSLSYLAIPVKLDWAVDTDEVGWMIDG